ncbi:unnamed protein product [Toxocara canis]|uniref:Saposin B-type domain-containing protein n=1 Tax=Toxocara canis TaxID=6265 RepID=A0A3P7GHY5_TOXCA|nr:unnamed protein product [Toxocara canis]
MLPKYFDDHKRLMNREKSPPCYKSSKNLGCWCPLCIDVVKFTSIMIIDHKEVEIKYLDALCRRAFSGDKQRQELCATIVNDELPELIRYLKEKTKAINICKKIKFC